LDVAPNIDNASGLAAVVAGKGGALGVCVTDLAAAAAAAAVE